jgi:rhodanese-related sulfurtransferase
MLRSVLRFTVAAAVACALTTSQTGCRRSGSEAATDAAAAAPDFDTATLQRLLESPAPPVIVDVRQPQEFAEGHLRGARNIPLGTIGARTSEIPKDKDVVVVCRGGRRSARAKGILVEKGFSNVHNYVDGMSGWKGPIER